jgi:hypothetical protein
MTRSTSACVRSEAAPAQLPVHDGVPGSTAPGGETLEPPPPHATSVIGIRLATKPRKKDFQRVTITG